MTIALGLNIQSKSFLNEIFSPSLGKLQGIKKANKVLYIGSAVVGLAELLGVTSPGLFQTAVLVPKICGCVFISYLTLCFHVNDKSWMKKCRIETKNVNEEGQQRTIQKIKRRSEDFLCLGALAFGAILHPKLTLAEIGLITFGSYLCARKAT